MGRGTRSISIEPMTDGEPIATQATARVSVTTSGQGFVMLNDAVDGWLQAISASNGLLTAFVRHTSASLTIQENADPTVRDDLLDSLDRFAPQNLPYRHNYEGADDMPAHIRTMVTSVHETVPVIDGRMDLGTWQGLYLIEHRTHPHRRTVTLHYAGS